MIDPTKFLISVVNYKAYRLIYELIDSLESCTLPADTVLIIVDNASNDGSVDKLNSYLDQQPRKYGYHILASSRNGGFAYGNNQAVKMYSDEYKGLPDYLLLLNPDTRVLPDSIESLLEFMTTHHEAGIAGSQLISDEGKPQVSCFRFHSIPSELISGFRLGLLTKLLHRSNVPIAVPDTDLQVEWVSGASMLIRKDLIQQIGLMDEAYFLYFEETDFCLQAKRAGWQCWYVNNSKVIHHEGKTTGIKSGSKSTSRRPGYWFESRQRYFRKNYGYIYTLIADSAWMLGFISWRIRRVVQKKEDNDPQQLLKDFFLNSAFRHRYTKK